MRFAKPPLPIDEQIDLLARRRNPRHVAGWFSPAEPRKLYNTLTMLAYLLGVASPKSTWVAHVRELVAGCPQAHPPAMGFPEGWRSVPIWEEQS